MRTIDSTPLYQSVLTSLLDLPTAFSQMPYGSASNIMTYCIKILSCSQWGKYSGPSHQKGLFLELLLIYILVCLFRSILKLHLRTQLISHKVSYHYFWFRDQLRSYLHSWCAADNIKKPLTKRIYKESCIYAFKNERSEHAIHCYCSMSIRQKNTITLHALNCLISHQDYAYEAYCWPVLTELFFYR